MGKWGKLHSFKAQLREANQRYSLFMSTFVFIYLVVILSKPEIQTILTLPEGSEVSFRFGHSLEFEISTLK